MVRLSKHKSIRLGAIRLIGFPVVTTIVAIVAAISGGRSNSPLGNIAHQKLRITADQRGQANPPDWNPCPGSLPILPVNHGRDWNPEGHLRPTDALVERSDGDDLPAGDARVVRRGRKFSMPRNGIGDNPLGGLDLARPVIFWSAMWSRSQQERREIRKPGKNLPGLGSHFTCEIPLFSLG